MEGIIIDKKDKPLEKELLNGFRDVKFPLAELPYEIAKKISDDAERNKGKKRSFLEAGLTEKEIELVADLMVKMVFRGDTKIEGIVIKEKDSSESPEE